MMRRLLIIYGTALVIHLTGAGVARAADAPKPNLILILADDLGYECLGCNGSTSYKTPALDRLNDYPLYFINRNKSRPFFLYYPMMLTHAPYQPTPDSPDWDPKAKGEQVHVDKKHFGEMVAYMDKLVGKLVVRLDELGLRQNTLVLFVGDNGTGRGVNSRMGDVTVAG